MKRFLGDGLPEQPRLAVIANDAIGNFVVATPLLQMLRRTYPTGTIHFFGGSRTRELQQPSDLFDDQFELHGPSFWETASLLAARAGTYDLTINFERTALAKVATATFGAEGFVCGPCVGPGGRGDLDYPSDARGDLWRDEAWISEDITSRYDFLTSGFMGEILARLAYLEGPVPRYRVPSQEPSMEVPDILFSASASLPDKIWPEEKWVDLISTIQRSGRTMGLIGAPPKVGSEHWKGGGIEDAIIGTGAVVDLRGRLSLSEVVGALARCKQVFTLDNGILHLACATDTRTIGLFRYGIHRLWAPPVSNLHVLVPEPHQIVADISVSACVEALGLHENSGLH